MPNVRLKNTSLSTYGHSVVVDIIDIDGANSEIEYLIEQPFFDIRLNGNKSDPFDPIKTISIDGNIILDDNTSFIFDDIFESQEGRFFVQVSIDNNGGGQLFYTGKIIADGLELDDRIRPTFYFKAVDGLTDLKGKTWDYPDPQMTIAEAICHCLNKLDIITMMPSAQMVFQSEITPNAVQYTNGRLADCTFVNNYFYNIENNEKVYFNCYDVLVEILNRLNLQMFAFGDIFYVIGNESLFGSRTKNASYYSVSNGNYQGTYNLSTDAVFTSLDITNNALSGGRYFFRSGYNKVTIESNPKFSNRKVGDTTQNKLVYPAITSVSYKRMPGVIKPDKEYKMSITVDVVSITKPSNQNVTPGFFTLTQSVREENISTTSQTVIVNGYSMIVPTNVGKYKDEIIIDDETYFRYMDITTSISGLSGTNMTSMVVNVSYTFSERVQDYDKIKVISEIPTSKFVNEKTIKLYGNHEKGNELVQFYFFSQANGIGFTNQFKFGSGAWKALEQLIAEDQLLRLGNMVELNIPYNDNITSFVYVGSTVTYKTENYKVIGMSMNPHTNIYNLELIRQVNNTGTIVTTYEVPVNDSNLNTSDLGTLNSINGNLNRYFAQYYKQIVIDGNYYEEDLDRYFNGELQEIRTSWNVYVNGVRYVYKDVNDVTIPPVAGELDIQEFTYIKASNRLYFGYDLDNSLVILHFIGTDKPDVVA